MEQIVSIQSEIPTEYFQDENIRMYKKTTARDLTVSLSLPRTCDDEGRQRASDEAAGSLPGAQRH